MRALLLSKTEACSTPKIGKKIRDIPMVTGKFVLGPLTVISGRRNAPNDRCAIVARCVIRPSTDVGDPSNETYLSSMAVDSDAFTDRTKPSTVSTKKFPVLFDQEGTLQKKVPQV